jgi:hypothetical protein
MAPLAWASDVHLRDSQSRGIRYGCIRSGIAHQGPAMDLHHLPEARRIALQRLSPYCGCCLIHLHILLCSFAELHGNAEVRGASTRAIHYIGSGGSSVTAVVCP